MVAFSILKCSDWTVASKHEQRDRKATPGAGSGRASTHWSLAVTLVVADTETSVQPGLDTPRPAAEFTAAAGVKRDSFGSLGRGWSSSRVVSGKRGAS